MANRHRKRVTEFHAIGRQGIDVGCWVALAAIAPDRIAPNIVGHD
jgi:hypothetical protein